MNQKELLKNFIQLSDRQQNVILWLTRNIHEVRTFFDPRLHTEQDYFSLYKQFLEQEKYDFAALAFVQAFLLQHETEDPLLFHFPQE